MENSNQNNVLKFPTQRERDQEKKQYLKSEAVATTYKLLLKIFYEHQGQAFTNLELESYMQTTSSNFSSMVSQLVRAGLVVQVSFKTNKGTGKTAKAFKIADGIIPSEWPQQRIAAVLVKTKKEGDVSSRNRAKILKRSAALKEFVFSEFESNASETKALLDLITNYEVECLIKNSTKLWEEKVIIVGYVIESFKHNQQAA